MYGSFSPEVLVHGLALVALLDHDSSARDALEVTLVRRANRAALMLLLLLLLGPACHHRDGPAGQGGRGTGGGRGDGRLGVEAAITTEPTKWS